MILYDFHCPTCGTTSEHLVDRGTEFVRCDCGGSAQRQFCAPKVRTVWGAAATFGGREAPPHPGMMDTRSLAEGEKYSEWKKRRQESRRDEMRARNGVTPKIYL